MKESIEAGHTEDQEDLYADPQVKIAENDWKKATLRGEQSIYD